MKAIQNNHKYIKCSSCKSYAKPHLLDITVFVSGEDIYLCRDCITMMWNMIREVDF